MAKSQDVRVLNSVAVKLNLNLEITPCTASYSPTYVIFNFLDSYSSYPPPPHRKPVCALPFCCWRTFHLLCSNFHGLCKTVWQQQTQQWHNMISHTIIFCSFDMCNCQRRCAVCANASASMLVYVFCAKLNMCSTKLFILDLHFKAWMILKFYFMMASANRKRQTINLSECIQVNPYSISRSRRSLLTIFSCSVNLNMPRVCECNMFASWNGAFRLNVRKIVRECVVPFSVHCQQQ